MMKENESIVESGGGGGTSGVAGKTGDGNYSTNMNGSPGVLPGGGGLVSALAAATAAARGSDGNQHAAALASLQRTVHELEATRDRLSEELVRAEGEAAAGRVSAARSAALEVEVAGVGQRYHSAMELLGEREEKIEELAADIVEMRDGYRQQVACLADEIERLRQRVLELETVQ
jgi:DnaJ-domain-containing protein 1